MSAAIGALVAHAAFWGLLAYGLWMQTLRLTRAILFLSLWIGGRVVLAYVVYGPAPSMFISWVAILDIALMLILFGGDIRLT